MRTCPCVSGTNTSFCPLSVLKIFRGIRVRTQFYGSYAFLQEKLHSALIRKEKKHRQKCYEFRQTVRRFTRIYRRAGCAREALSDRPRNQQRQRTSTAGSLAVSRWHPGRSAAWLFV